MARDPQSRRTQREVPFSAWVVLCGLVIMIYYRGADRAAWGFAMRRLMIAAATLGKTV